MATLLTFIALKDKPTGGYRPIALTSGLYRCWSQVRKHYLQQWESEFAVQAHVWDRAHHGSSALTAGLRRTLKIECSKLAGISFLSLFTDAQKFYDHISWDGLVGAAASSTYPRKLLFLALQQHQCANVLISSLGVSKWTLPHRSLLAGCVQSVSLTKVLLAPLIFSQYSPLWGSG